MKIKMMILPALVLALWLPRISSAAGCDEPRQTTAGLVRGMSDPATASCVWKGVPFAAPPVGDLRWRPPEEPEPGDGVRDTVEFSRQCVQLPGMLSDKKLGYGEDCLYLNIWAPQKSGVFPVMFWIHGGGLNDGTASIPMYEGSHLAAQKDVVLVSINYRLGPFGFLSLPEFADENERGSSGNYGLLDQVRGLQWVRENIAAFGGDPDNVTIFGESAGGRSVCSLLACPPARGLFQRAIIESGGCAAKATEKCYQEAELFASYLGCTGPDRAACLRSKSADAIMEAVKTMRKSTEPLGDDPVEFKICVDGWSQTQDALAAIQQGDFNNVPVMVGTNRDEFKLFVLRALPLYWRLLPTTTLDKLTRERFKPRPGDELRYDALYPPGDWDRPADRWIAGVTDATYSCRGLAAVEAVAKNQPDTYYYRFDYDDHRLAKLIGAAHGTELVFIFDTLKQKGIFNLYGPRELREGKPMVEIMMSYWTNFAKFGDPNGPGLPEWPAFNLQERQRMFLDLPSEARPDLLVKDRCDFWADQDTGGW